MAKTKKKASALSCIGITISIIFIPLLAILLYSIYQIRSTSAPPSDFGSGSMFDKIAHRYDLINRVLALNLDTSWRRIMVREILNHASQASQQQPLKFLDLATGTADVAILLAEEAIQRTDLDSSKSSLSVVGVDPSRNMIEIGNQKLNSKTNNLSDIVTLQIGNAMKLNEFDDGTFDGVTMAFGIRNVPQRDVALCEIHRVLKRHDHSRLAILEFSEPEDSGVMGYLARLFIRYVVPILGATLSGFPKEYMHLQNSIQEFPSPKEFVALMENLRCESAGAGGGDDDEDEEEVVDVGTFRVEKLHQMNFGSVQLYVAQPVFKKG